VDMVLTAPSIALISYLCYEVAGSCRPGRADARSAKTRRRDRRHRRRDENFASVPMGQIVAPREHDRIQEVLSPGQQCQAVRMKLIGAVPVGMVGARLNTPANRARGSVS